MGIVLTVTVGVAAALPSTGAATAATHSSAPPRLVARDSSATGVLTGVLTDARTRRPIVGACIQAKRHGGGNYGAWTRANGQYRFTGLPAGRYLVELNVPSCTHYAVDYASVARSTVREATVPAGGAATLNALLPRDDEVQGRVVDATTGQGITGLCSYIPGSYIGSVRTSATGGFAIHGLTGPLRLSFSDCRHARGYQYPTVWWPDTTVASEATEMPVGFYRSLRSVEIKVAPTGGVSGSVHNEAGQPIAEICVMSDNGLGNGHEFFANDGQDSDAVTNAAGEFTDDDLPAGTTYRVFATTEHFTPADLANSDAFCALPPYWYVGGNESNESATLVTVTSGQSTPGISIVVPQSFLIP